MAKHESISEQKNLMGSTNPPKLLVIDTGGTITDCVIEEASDVSFDHFRTLTERPNMTIEMIDAEVLSACVDVAILAFINENGIAESEPFNEIASALIGQQVRGPVVFVNSAVFYSFEEEEEEEEKEIEGLDDDSGDEVTGD